MTLIIRHKIELILNNSMKRYFDQCFGYSRYAWNKLLAAKNENKLLLLNDLLKQFKKDREKWEYAMPSYIPTYEMQNLKQTLKRYHKANFKTKKKEQFSFYADNSRFLKGSFETMVGKHMKFALTLGAKCRIRPQDRWMKLTEIPYRYGEKDVRILSVTIMKEIDRYYGSFCIEIPGRGLTTGTGFVGIDPGVHSVMTLSEGTVYILPKKLKKLDQRAKHYQKRMSKKYVLRAKEQSKRYKNAKIKHQKTLRHKNRIKQDFLHQATTTIVRENQLIAWEDCKPKRLMKNHKLARSIGESCWFTTKQMLQQKCEMHGAEFILVDPLKAATQTCSICGHRFTGDEKLDLSQRTYVCPHCGFEEDRDVNAAMNIIKFALQTLAGAQPSE